MNLYAIYPFFLNIFSFDCSPTKRNESQLARASRTSRRVVGQVEQAGVWLAKRIKEIGGRTSRISACAVEPTGKDERGDKLSFFLKEIFGSSLNFEKEKKWYWYIVRQSANSEIV